MNIPNFVDIQFVDKNGYLTPEWKIIIQQLLKTLVDNASEEGLVAPTQDNANVALIEGHQVPASTGIGTVYTCRYGTLLYNSDLNVLMVALNNAGVPKFYTVVTI